MKTAASAGHETEEASKSGLGNSISIISHNYTVSKVRTNSGHKGKISMLMIKVLLKFLKYHSSSHIAFS